MKELIKNNRIICKLWIVFKNCTFIMRLYAKYYKRFFMKKLEKNGQDYPNTIQLPITYKCNYDCVMCGMRKLIKKPGFSSNELGCILSDKLFSKIKSVGLNGGEPFILNNLVDYVQVLIDKLKTLENIYIITNGYFTHSILTQTREIKELCKKNNISLSLSISLDGFGEMQNKMRGHGKAFEKCTETIKKIQENQELYCDSFRCICTITKINIYHLAELEAWCQREQIPITFNIATIHERISNEEKYKDFSVFTDDNTRLFAAEFFYSKFLEDYNERYFGLYYLLRYGERISSCSHKKQVVSITPNGGVAYCATHSKEIGNVNDKSAYDIYFDKDNITYREKIESEYCSRCSQYADYLSCKAYKENYIKEIKNLNNYYD